MTHERFCPGSQVATFYEFGSLDTVQWSLPTKSLDSEFAWTFVFPPLKCFVSPCTHNKGLFFFLEPAYLRLVLYTTLMTEQFSQHGPSSMLVELLSQDSVGPDSVYEAYV